MLLGDVIARFDDEAAANETLLSLGDLALMLRVTTLAAEHNVSAGQLAMLAVGHFVNAAGDEDWLNLVGQMTRAEDPGAVFLRRVLSSAMSDR
jgi:hypothetical protein